jgi:hypothetical protein
MLASDFKLDDELKNVILAVFRHFAFSYSQGHKPPNTFKVRDFRFSALKADHCSALSRGGFGRNRAHDDVHTATTAALTCSKLLAAHLRNSITTEKIRGTKRLISLSLTFGRCP